MPLQDNQTKSIPQINLIRNYYEIVVNQRQLSRVHEFITSTATLTMRRQTFNAISYTLQSLSELLQRHPDLRITVRALVLKGDFVEAHWFLTGTETKRDTQNSRKQIVNYEGITLHRISKTIWITEVIANFTNISIKNAKSLFQQRIDRYIVKPFSFISECIQLHLFYLKVLKEKLISTLLSPRKSFLIKNEEQEIKKNIEHIKEYLAYFLSENLTFEKLKSYFTNTCTIYTPEGPLPYLQHLQQISHSIHLAMPHFRSKIIDIYGINKKVTCRWSIVGKQVSSLDNKIASHIEVIINGCSIYELDNGKIAKMWFNFHTKEVSSQSDNQQFPLPPPLSVDH